MHRLPIAAMVLGFGLAACGRAVEADPQVEGAGTVQQASTSGVLFYPDHDIFTVPTWNATTCDAAHNCVVGGDYSSKLRDLNSVTVGNTFIYHPPNSGFQCSSLDPEALYLGMSEEECLGVYNVVSVTFEMQVYTGVLPQTIPLRITADRDYIGGSNFSINVPAHSNGGLFLKTFTTNPMTGQGWTPGDFGCGRGQHGRLHQDPYIGWCSNNSSSGWSMAGFGMVVRYTPP